MVNTEATNRTSADTNLNNLINVEKVAREEAGKRQAEPREMLYLMPKYQRKKAFLCKE
jgi:hypothetical protein